MSKKKTKARYNVYLDQESVDLVKEFIKGTGLSLSSYLDLMTCIAADRIIDFYAMLDSDNLGEDDYYKENRYFNILTAHRVLRLADSQLKNIRLSSSQIKKIKTGKWHIDLDEEYGIRINMFKKKGDKIKKE